ncbi:hypothetical protein AZ66_21520, partial [Paenibacillus sp. E194]|uniref:nucleoside-diphosphate sugar epimerase/dehydratase n=1 Tax=Paenibacillus sp. E194 TaxID=1458845 RepID=UPI0005CA2A8D
MSLPVQLNKKLNQGTNLLIAEDIAAYNRKTDRIKLTLNIGLIATEYILYMIGFFILFYYKVISEYGSFNWNKLHESIAKIPVLDDYVLLIGIIFTIYTAMLYQQGIFKWNRDIRIVDDTLAAIKAVSTSFLIALGIAFFLKTSIVYSRVLILMLAILMVFVFLLSRVMKTYAHALLRRSARYNKNVLIIGAGKVGMQIRNHILANTSCRFVGFLDDYKRGDQVLGTIQNIEQLIAHH